MSVATRVTSTERVTSICRLYDHTRLLSLSAIGHGQRVTYRVTLGVSNRTRSTAIGHGQRTIYILSASTVGHGQRKIHRVTLGIGYRTRPKDNTEGYSRHQQSDTVKGQRPKNYSRRIEHSPLHVLRLSVKYPIACLHAYLTLPRAIRPELLKTQSPAYVLT